TSSDPSPFFGQDSGPHSGPTGTSLGTTRDQTGDLTRDAAAPGPGVGPAWPLRVLGAGPMVRRAPHTGPHTGAHTRPHTSDHRPHQPQGSKRHWRPVPSGSRLAPAGNWDATRPAAG